VDDHDGIRERRRSDVAEARRRDRIESTARDQSAAWRFPRGQNSQRSVRLIQLPPNISTMSAGTPTFSVSSAFGSGGLKISPHTTELYSPDDTPSPESRLPITFARKLSTRSMRRAARSLISSGKYVYELFEYITRNNTYAYV
jgi:hypothetical protein